MCSLVKGNSIFYRNFRQLVFLVGMMCIFKNYEPSSILMLGGLLRAENTVVARLHGTSYSWRVIRSLISPILTKKSLQQQR